MRSVDIAWFRFDLPDRGVLSVETTMSVADVPAITVWTVALGAALLRITLSATSGLSDLSRTAFDAKRAATPLSVGGLPGVRSGSLDAIPARVEWAFTLNGLTLELRLVADHGVQAAEWADMQAVIDSLRRVTP